MEDYKVPMTFKQKAANFWYYYKVLVIIILAVALVGGWALFDTLIATKPDVIILVAGSNATMANEDALMAAESYLQDYVPDFNKDGKHVVFLNAISLPADAKPGGTGSNALAKFLAEISMNNSYLLILDKTVYDNFTISDVALPIGSYVHGLTLDDPNKLPVSSLPMYAGDGPLSVFSEGMFFAVKDVVNRDRASAKYIQRFDDNMAFLNNLVSGTKVVDNYSSSSQANSGSSGSQANG